MLGASREQFTRSSNPKQLEPRRTKKEFSKIKLLSGLIGGVKSKTLILGRIFFNLGTHTLKYE